MKKILSLILCLAMLLSLAACSGGNSTASGAGTTEPSQADTPSDDTPATDDGGDAEEPHFTVGILVPYASNDATFHLNNGLFMETADKNIEYILVDAGDNQSTQNDQCQTLINKGVDAIYCSPVDSDAAPTILDICRQANIPVMIESRLPTMELWLDMINSYEHLYYFGPDIQAPGVIQAEMLLAKWNETPEWDKNGDGKIQICYVHGAIGHQNSEGRREGFYATLDASGVPYEELDYQLGAFNAATAKEITETWIAKYGDQIEAIVSVTDAMAFGVVEALHAAGYNNGGDNYIPVYGVNGLPEACDAITNGDMQATVYTSQIGQGKIMGQVIYNVLTGADPSEGVDPALSVMDENHCFYVIPTKVETPEEVAAVLLDYEEENAYIAENG